MHPIHRYRLCAACRSAPENTVMSFNAARNGGLVESDLCWMRSGYEADQRVYLERDVIRALHDKYRPHEYFDGAQRTKLARERSRAFFAARKAVLLQVRKRLIQQNHTPARVQTYLDSSEFQRRLLFHGDHRRPESITCEDTLDALVQRAAAHLRHTGHE